MTDSMTEGLRLAFDDARRTFRLWNGHVEDPGFEDAVRRVRVALEEARDDVDLDSEAGRNLADAFGLAIDLLADAEETVNAAWDQLREVLDETSRNVGVMLDGIALPGAGAGDGAE